MASTDLSSLLGGGYNPIRQSNQMLQQGQQAGLFDPFGSPRIRALLRQRAMSLYGSGQQNAQGLSHLYGLDPYQQRSLLAGQGIMGTGQRVNALNNAEYAGATSNLPFYQGLFNRNLSFAQQQELHRQQQDAQRQGGFGQLLGTGLGLLTGNFGGLFGGGGGGGGGGGSQAAYEGMYQPGNSFDPYAGYSF